MTAPVRIRFVVLEGELDEATAAKIRDAISAPDTLVLYPVPSIAAIVERVSYETGVHCHVIVGTSQTVGAVRARYAALWVARIWAGKPLGMLQASFNDRDHSSILYGIGRAKHMREREPAFLQLCDKVIAHFTGAEL